MAKYKVGDKVSFQESAEEWDEPYSGLGIIKECSHLGYDIEVIEISDPEGKSMLDQVDDAGYFVTDVEIKGLIGDEDE